MIARIASRLPRLMALAFAPTTNWRALNTGCRMIRVHARLILEMAKEDLVGRYRGQVFGSAWILIHPLALTFLYLFLFGVVFAQRVGGTREMPLDYTAYLLSGLIPWLTFQGSIGSSVNAVTSNSALVKQFVFPIEVLPIRDVVSSTIIWFVGLGCTLAYVILGQRTAMATWVLLPLLLILQLLAMAGVAFLLSATAVFFRDMKDFVNLFSLVALFLMPVVYLPGWVPPLFKPLMWLNPFTYMVWAYQDALYFGRFAHPMSWVLFAGASPLVFAWGVRLFRSTKPLFSSAL